LGRSGKLRASAALIVTAIALPASAVASSGGSGLPSPTTQPLTASGVPVESATGDGITFSSRSVGLLGGTAWFGGSLASGAGGQTVLIQRQSGQSWVTIAAATTGSGGSFSVAWHANVQGSLSVRAATRAGASGSPALTLVVYRASIATEYGPGLYGRRTACGAVLRRTTIGVANRKLPCGASVSIYYRGRTVVVPVIDRGPYANGANWDLTMATGRALGIYGTTKIGALAVPTT
jgi:rare lipoprotein A